MALLEMLPVAELGAPAALTIDGLVVAAVGLWKFPSDDQPLRRLWLFRSPTIRRVESDDV